MGASWRVEGDEWGAIYKTCFVVIISLLDSGGVLQP